MRLHALRMNRVLGVVLGAGCRVPGVVVAVLARMPNRECRMPVPP